MAAKKRAAKKAAKSKAATAAPMTTTESRALFAAGDAVIVEGTRKGTVKKVAGRAITVEADSAHHPGDADYRDTRDFDIADVLPA